MINEIISYLSTNQFAGGAVSAVVLGGVMAYARSVPTKLWRYVVHYSTIEVEVSNDQPAYYWLALMLGERLGDRARKLSIVRNFNITRSYDDDETVNNKLHLIAGLGSHFMWIGWNPVVIQRMREKEALGETPRESITMVMPFWMRHRISDLVSEAQAVAKPNQDNIVVYISQRNNHGWYRSGSIRKRPISTVVLAPELESRILGTVRSFMESRDWYYRASVPHRLGLLFEGYPGTGKSSAAHALASEFDLPIYALNLSDVSSDGNLFGLFGDLPEKCLVLIEDIDAAVKAVRKRDDDDDADVGKGVTLSGLLNALDGAIAAQGRIVVMSTNHPEKIDPALLRPGRCDARIQFGLADEDQVRRMYRLFIGSGDETVFVTEHAGKSHAEVQEALLRLRAEIVAGREEKNFEEMAA